MPGMTSLAERPDFIGGILNQTLLKQALGTKTTFVPNANSSD